MKLFCKASLAFKRLRASAKPAFGTNVIYALTPPVTAKKAKATLTDLPVPVADLQVLNDNLAAAISDSLTGNHTAVASVKNAVIAWDEAFTLTANFITTLAAGNAQWSRCAH